MSRIETIAPEKASGPSKELLERVEAKYGQAPNTAKTMAQAPAVLESYLALGDALGGGLLPPELRERIALAVAEINGCRYCLAAHSYVAGKVLGIAEQEIQAARRSASADPKVDEALKFARAVVEQRGGVSDAELARVRVAGFSDAEVLEIVGNVAVNVLTNYVNKVAQVEPDFPAAEPLRAAA